jgi:hypothetical protein
MVGTTVVVPRAWFRGVRRIRIETARRTRRTDGEVATVCVGRGLTCAPGAPPGSERRSRALRRQQRRFCACHTPLGPSVSMRHGIIGVPPIDSREPSVRLRETAPPSALQIRCRESLSAVAEVHARMQAPHRLSPHRIQGPLGHPYPGDDLEKPGGSRDIDRHAAPTPSQVRSAPGGTPLVVAACFRSEHRRGPHIRLTRTGRCARTSRKTRSDPRGILAVATHVPAHRTLLVVSRPSVVELPLERRCLLSTQRPCLPAPPVKALLQRSRPARSGSESPTGAR